MPRRDDGATVRRQSWTSEKSIKKLFSGKKGVDSKQKVFSAMGSHETPLS
jgi:hypothetical protein